ncbi:NAD(P)H-dependent oxidoreductase, partial [Aeromonas veronii]|uniref:NAD(P)H-dependent oxidoreductase n=1 Tax=Aeromonas veronii TaxID=654 RepID=UPI001FD0AB5C
RTRTGSWPLLSYAPWVLQLLSEFAGPVGMVENTRALVISPRGGMHVGSATDLVTPYMRTVLGFIGIKEVDFIYAEGMGMGPDAQSKGMEAAKAQLEALAI